MITNEHKPLSNVIANQLVNNLAGKSCDSPEYALVEEARRIARDEENPFPLCALQFPSLVIDASDPDADKFEGVIGSKTNPKLRLDWWQRLILKAAFDKTIREIYVKGCTGPGKGAIMAITTNLIFDAFQECRYHLTSETFEHAKTNIFGEVSMWHAKMRYPGPGEVHTADITESQRHYIKVLNPRPAKGGEAFSGAHGPGTYYLFDEASAAEANWFENAAKNAYKIFALANPRTTVGHFREAFRGLKNENKTSITQGVLGRRLCVTVGGMDCLNVKYGRLRHPVAPLDGITINGKFYAERERIDDADYVHVKPLIENQIDLNQFRAIVKKADQPWKVNCFAHGKFADENPDTQVILSKWLPVHNQYHSEQRDHIRVKAFGLDVARSLDGDDSCFVPGGSDGVKAIHQFKCGKYPEIASTVKNIAFDEYGIDLTKGAVPVCIDYGGGYGAGVGDWLEEEGVWIIPHIPGGRAQVLPEVYQDQRTEGYALLARRLNPDDLWGEFPFGIPDNLEINSQLTLVQKIWNNDQTKWRAMPKELIKKELNRSPDQADGIMLLFTAIRELDQLDYSFRSSSVSVMTYPYTKQTESTRADNPQDALNDLLEWMRSR